MRFHVRKAQVQPGKKELMNLLLTEARWPKNLIREAVQRAFEVSARGGGRRETKLPDPP